MQIIKRTVLVAILTSVFSAAGIAFQSPPQPLLVPSHFFVDVLAYRLTSTGDQAGYLLFYGTVTTGRGSSAAL
jgi:hypothetical protein